MQNRKMKITEYSIYSKLQFTFYVYLYLISLAVSLYLPYSYPCNTTPLISLPHCYSLSLTSNLIILRLFLM